MSNLVSDIETLIKDQKYYDAQQIYKRIIHKFMKTGSYEKAIQVLLNAITEMSKAHQAALCHELALKALNIFETAQFYIDAPSLSIPNQESIVPLGVIIQILEAYPSDTPSKMKIEFLNACVAWNAKIPQGNDGPKKPVSFFHHKLALEYWKGKIYLFLSIFIFHLLLNFYVLLFF